MPKHPLKTFLLHAQAAQKAGKFDQSRAILTQAVKDYPKAPKPLLELGFLLLRKHGRADNVLPILPRLLKLAPKSARVHELAAETYCRLRQYDMALQHAQKTVALGPKAPDGLYVAATCYDYAARYEEAIDLMRRALALRPDHRPSKLLLASSLNSAGKQSEAETICRELFAEHPANLHNLSLWSRTVKATADDPIYLYIRDDLLPNMDEGQKMPRYSLHRILGRAENEIGNYDAAFDHFSKSKALEAKRHDRLINRRFVGGLIAGTSRSDFFGISGNDSENPVLIVGMPRSGSTLLEQVLSSHPAIGGIGEHEELRQLATSAGFREGDGPGLAKIIRDLTPQKAGELAALYLKRSESLAPGFDRVVCKNLHNFEFLGLFAKMFPKARILVSSRDPMDNCVSCYLQHLNEFHSYTQDLTSLGQYYCDYRRLIEHWKKTIPNPMLEVSYEGFIENSEGVARHVIDFLGLDWDPACLDFQSNASRVRTISANQVRKPIYKSSAGRWRRYETFLDPLKEELREFYPGGFSNE